jgi:chitin disaccharide deacetylase
MKSLALCADDYGLGAAVDQGILHLLQRGRLQAVSCLSSAPGWPAGAQALARAAGQASVGLHFNLTEGRPLTAALQQRHARWPGLASVLVNAHLGRLPLSAVAEELQAQLGAFTAAYGQTPAHIDGHQHVHHLPGVRAVVLAAAARLQPRPALRSTAPLLGPGFAFKRWVIQASGGRALAAELASDPWRHNTVLTGVYSFGLKRRHGQHGHYRQCMRDWLAALPAGGGALLFCHPAMPGSAPAAGDAIAAARAREFSYLDSDEFARDLAAAGAVLAPAW